MLTLWMGSASRASCTVTATQHLDLRQTICANLSHDRVKAWAAKSHGLKRAFFQRLQNATAPYRLSGVPDRGNHNPVLDRMHDEASHRIDTAAHIALIGYSIENSLAYLLRRIAPNARISVFYGGGEFWLANAPELLAHDRFGASSAANPKQEEVSMRQFLGNLTAGPGFDAVFVGGFGVHRLVRYEYMTSDGWLSPDANVTFNGRPTFSPYLKHLHFVRRLSERLLCLSEAFSIPFVLVGTLPVDSEVMLLDPPKDDWRNFVNVQLADVMYAAEKDVEAELVAADRCNPPGASLSFFHHAELARACPGVRCDGIHFTSQYSAWSCLHSLGLVAPFLADFFAQKLPQLLSTSHNKHEHEQRARGSAARNPRADFEALRRTTQCLPPSARARDSSMREHDREVTP